jgi:hypothetical protein
MAGDLRWAPSQQSTCILIIRGVEGDNGGFMRLLIGRKEQLHAGHLAEALWPWRMCGSGSGAAPEIWSSIVPYAHPSDRVAGSSLEMKIRAYRQVQMSRNLGIALVYH